MDPITMAIIGGGLVSGIGSWLGGRSQANANNQNLAAQQAWQRQMQGMVQGQMQTGTNPYAQQMMQFLGMQAPPPNGPGGVPAQGLPGLQLNPNMVTRYGQQQQGAPPGTGGYYPGQRQQIPQGGNDWGQADNGMGIGVEGMPNFGIDPSMVQQMPGIGVGGQNFGIEPSQMSMLQGMIGGPINDPRGPRGGLTPPPQPLYQQGQMYQYQNQNPFTAQANTLNLAGLPQVTAPTVNGTNVAAPGALTAGQVGMAPGFDLSGIDLSKFMLDPSQVTAPEGFDLTKLGMPGALTAPKVEAGAIDLGIAGGTPGFNTGQDALMQMLRGGVMQGPDAGLTQALQGAGANFGMDPMMQALQKIDQTNLNDQVSQLRGSAGSLGERLGSAGMLAEGEMRGNFLDQISGRNQQLAQSSFEQAQGRNLQSLGLQTQREQFFAQQPVQSQIAIAQALQQGGLGSSDIMARLAQANAGNQLQASQATGSNALAAMLQGQNLGQQAGQFNIGNQMQMGQMGMQQQMQAALANQQAGLSAGQSNLSAQSQAQQAMMQAALQQGLQGQQLGTQVNQQNIANQMQMGQFNNQQALQAALANQQNQMQGGMANQSSALQAMLANQSLMGQGQFRNQDALNNFSQFNAQQRMMQDQFGAQQGNIYNQLMMGGMSQAAGLQNQQSSLNAQLLGILGGVGVPQAQASPWGGMLQDLGGSAMMMPLLLQMMRGK